MTRLLRAAVMLWGRSFCGLCAHARKIRIETND